MQVKGQCRFLCSIVIGYKLTCKDFQTVFQLPVSSYTKKGTSNQSDLNFHVKACLLRLKFEHEKQGRAAAVVDHSKNNNNNNPSSSTTSTNERKTGKWNLEKTEILFDATIQHNPYNQDYGKVGAAWKDVMTEVNSKVNSNDNTNGLISIKRQAKEILQKAILAAKNDKGMTGVTDGLPWAYNFALQVKQLLDDAEGANNDKKGIYHKELGTKRTNDARMQQLSKGGMDHRTMGMKTLHLVLLKSCLQKTSALKNKKQWQEINL
ncbi:hypothetical protein K501DRAFT_273535 [Backusella circina FSU 941]|nr:hypothetical protein K501DRAFT_273535 [Backusella circina FSU 941]